MTPHQVDVLATMHAIANGGDDPRPKQSTGTPADMFALQAMTRM
ncbi:MAG: hypothetical protein ACRCZP_00480 [Phycicoccus sp.]